MKKTTSSFFEKKQLITYSKSLSLKLNEDMVKDAQQKIYALNMANSSDLSGGDVVDSVLHSLKIPEISSYDYAYFEMAFALAISRAKEIKWVSYADFRLSNINFNKVLQLLDIYAKIEKKSKVEPINTEISMVVNSILVMFEMYDIENNRMFSYMGMKK